MNTIASLTVAQLKRAISLREKIESLQSEFDRLTGGAGSTTPAPKTGKRKMSAAGRARIVAAQKARWAVIRGKKAKQPKVKAKRKMSAAGRAAISAAAKARWAKVKSEGKTQL